MDTLSPGMSILPGAVIDKRVHDCGVVVPEPSLTVNGGYCSIMTYKLEPTLPLGIGVDKIYRTDPTTLINLFFQTDREAYKEEIKKTSTQKAMDQEQVNDIYYFLFHRTAADCRQQIKYYTDLLVIREREEKEENDE